MKILNVLPVTAKNLFGEKEEAYIRKYLDKDTVVDTVQIEKGTLSIEGAYDEAINTPAVIELCIQGEKDGYDAIFIDCFGDPGVHAARECVDIPVFGGFEPAVLMALGLADRIGVVTVLENVVTILERHIAEKHLQERIVTVRNVGIPVLDLSDHGKLCDAVTKESIEAIEKEKVQAIVLGCTGMVDVTETVESALHERGYDIPVIEAAQTALNTLEMYAKMGKRHSRLTYLRPTMKAE